MNSIERRYDKDMAFWQGQIARKKNSKKLISVQSSCGLDTECGQNISLKA